MNFKYHIETKHIIYWTEDLECHRKKAFGFRFFGFYIGYDNHDTSDAFNIGYFIIIPFIGSCHIMKQGEVSKGKGDLRFYIFGKEYLPHKKAV